MTNNKTYHFSKIGRTAPIFLCTKGAGKGADKDTLEGAVLHAQQAQNTLNCRLYVDASKGAVIKLQYTFDDEEFISRRPQETEWHDHESGLIYGDFACALCAHVSAVRLHINALGQMGAVVLALELTS